eukprot:661341-Pyramimonas_sp.AAC.1
MAHIVLLSKEGGGFRPIALLPSVYRAWTKLRLVYVRRWARDHARPYFAMGVKKCTVDAAARLLARLEAAA